MNIWNRIKKLFRKRSFIVPKIVFICEQDGTVEKKIKSEWCQLFEVNEEVIRAYLVRVRYNNENNDLNSLDVALCIKQIAGNCEETVKKVGKIFESHFGSDQHLDIGFLNDEQESRITKVAKPFYRKC